MIYLIDLLFAVASILYAIGNTKLGTNMYGIINAVIARRVAVIPVFKIAENESELKKYRDKKRELTKAEKKKVEKEERRKKREEKRQRIIEAKYAETGATVPKKEYEHLEAHIDYIQEGGYYLIRYEMGFLRAWGAIKVTNFNK